MVIQDDASPSEDEEVNNPQCGEQDNNQSSEDNNQDGGNGTEDVPGNAGNQRQEGDPPVGDPPVGNPPVGGPTMDDYEMGDQPEKPQEAGVQPSPMSE